MRDVRVNCVRSKDAQKQLARTPLKAQCGVFYELSLGGSFTTGLRSG